MRYTIFTRTLPLLLASGMLLPLPVPAQDPSVADAARRAREQKKNAQKPATVITDDTLKPAVSNVQLGTVSTSDGSTPADNAEKPADTRGRDTIAAAPLGPTPAETEEKKRALESLKQQIEEHQKDVELSERELALDNDSFYGQPNYQDDKSGKARLDQEKADLDAKRAELLELKNKLTEMGGTYEAKPPAPPTRQYVQVP